MLQGLAKEIWKKKYKYESDNTWEDTARRVGQAIGAVEQERDLYINRFTALINDQVLIPGGRITAGAGTRSNYLLNCAVLPLEDSMLEIAETQKKATIMFQANYGVGYNFSSIRPMNSKLSRGGVASGPVSFMGGFDAWGKLVETGGGRRAAQIAVLNVHHPDILEFIGAKRVDGVLAQFNISVGITKEFINAVENDLDFDLWFPIKGEKVVHQTVSAVDLFNKLCESGWLHNDPGMLMVDEVNYYNNGYYLYTIDATNPCGELPLPPYGVCCLGNINLCKFIINAFGDSPAFDRPGYERAIRLSVRFLDNVLDVSEYPYDEILNRVKGDRRIGLNPLAGLGSALAMLKLPYDSKLARDWTGEIAKIAMEVAYDESVNLAIEKGSFLNFDRDRYLEGNFIAEKLPYWLIERIKEHGIRNIAILTVPPVGTGSLLAGNISNGLEPIFSLEYNRKVRQPNGEFIIEPVEDYAWKLYKKLHEDAAEMAIDFKLAGIPSYFKTSREIDPIDHVNMQAAIQVYIDGSLSKTANLPESYSLEDYKKLLMYAIKMGCKGFTTFREGTREGVLTEKASEPKLEASAPTDASFPTERPRALDGKTYQIKEEGDHRTYCTVNHIENGDKKRPWEMFLFSSSRNHELYTAIGRLASRLMRKTGDAAGVIKELKEIGGEHGYLTKEYGYVQSKPQHLGFILEEYINGINKAEVVKEYCKCPECGEMSYHKEGGCSKCLDCGYSTCG